ncbi:hypothetical protein [Streptomyces fulvoviolaceus]|uniref:hypothetical protein n=1 Tax=Streptomyces fulvoviolaceus TaxID=285535 RepID=UPI0004C62EE4|nr:hypothetical protein [Streptomyces fulvoviolaceus]
MSRYTGPRDIGDAEDGSPRIVEELTLPATGRRVVTDLADINVTPDGMHLVEVASGTTPHEVRAATVPDLLVPDGGGQRVRWHRAASTTRPKAV